MPLLLLTCSILPVGALGQTLPGSSPFNPPPPAPIPPPKIEVPQVPQFDAPPSQPVLRSPRTTSFGDRFNACLDEAASAGVRAGRRNAYARACANR